MLKLSASALALAACFTLTGQAIAQESSPGATSTQGPAVDTDVEGRDVVVIVGMGETRSVSTLVPSNLDVLPPGTSIQKALNMLPGVMAQSIDALGVNEQSLSLQVRGFNTTTSATRLTACRWAMAHTTTTTASRSAVRLSPRTSPAPI